MDCLLIGGAQSVGKSETIFRLTNRLITKGFIVVAGVLPTTFADFKVVLEGLNLNGKKVRIVINSATDTVDIINHFKSFYNNNGNCDILISSIRDDNFWPRQDFFTIMNINSTKDFILEIPLAKITRRGANFNVALNWYENQLDILVDHSLTNLPFQI